MNYTYSKFLLFVIAMLSMNCSRSQTLDRVYTKASELTLVGKILPTKNIFHRLDTVAYPGLPSSVKKMLTNSAGLAVSFSTNSKIISAKWEVSDKKQLPNLTAFANKGLDLYIKRNGQWQFAGTGRPTGIANEAVLVKDMDSSEKECLLYMPLYDEISALEIGTEQKAMVKPAAKPFRKRILIYGSSIVQGASASRPGLAYPARLSRETGLNFLNLGLSGSAKMETAAADMVASIPADAYILDCVPNSSPEQITERTGYLVSAIRKKNPSAPVIIVQSIIREHGYFDQAVGKRVAEQNANMKEQFGLLQQAGVKNLYLISAENLLGNDHEGTADGTHPNDLGFDRMLQILKPEIMAILKKHGVNGDK